jgi:hypothetical protein
MALLFAAAAFPFAEVLCLRDESTGVGIRPGAKMTHYLNFFGMSDTEGWVVSERERRA